MSKQSPLQSTFDTLRGILAKQAKSLLVTVDKPGEYQLSSPTLKDRTGRPLFVAAVQIRKNYVSYHLIPVYTTPALLDTVSAALRKRMQGKSCFNFTSIEPDQAKELAALTKAGVATLQTLQLPWGNRPGSASRSRS
jgi:hypothetical protein